jgi:nucleoside-diphosphate-sugar epimerase
LGWRAQENFDSGIEKTVQWYLDNAWWWQRCARIMMANGWDCWRNLREDRGDRQDRAGRDILIERAGKGVTIIPLGRPEMDLANQATIAPALAAARADVVSAAAYTAVDRAESEAEAAFAINATGAGAVAAAASALGLPLIFPPIMSLMDPNRRHIGKDPVAPLGVYGASKLAGEQAVIKAAPDAVILRTAWRHSSFARISSKPCCALPKRVRNWAWSPIRSAIRPARSTLPMPYW